MFQAKKLMIAATLALAGLMAIPAAAQYGYGRDNRGGYYGDESQNQAYQQGYKDGLWDNQHGQQNRNRYWKNSDDARAYRDGYNAAYRGGGYSGRNGDWDRDNHRRSGAWNNGSWGYGNGSYGNGGYGNSGYARQGYIDGMNDGSSDRQSGHSFRPTEWAGYKHADRGYSSASGMSKDQYKQAYRDSYMQGYQRGYYGGRR
jgi:hypothetical protein